MAARPDVLIAPQLGLESTHGTNVTCATKLSDIGVEFMREMVTQFFRKFGAKYATAGVKHHEHTVGRYEGILGYNSILWPLSSIFGVSIGSQIGVTGAYPWTSSPNTSALDPWKSYTMQIGDASAADEIAYAAFASLTIEFGEDTITISGDILGDTIDSSVSLDTVTVNVPSEIVSVADLKWYVDSAYGSIGTTEWTDVLRATLTIPMKLVVKRVHGRTGLRDLVEVAVEQTMLSITAEYNSQTRTFLDAQRADTLPVRYIQGKAIGENIGLSADYTFKANHAVKLEKCQAVRNLQGVYGYQFDYRCVDDIGLSGSPMGRAIEFSGVAKVSALS